MKYIAILTLLVLSLCVSVYFVMGKNGKKYQEPDLKKLPERTPDEVEQLKNELGTGEVLMIESGAVMAEQQSTSTTENYVQRPKLHLCNGDRLKTYLESCKPFVAGPCPAKDKKTQQLDLPSYCNVIEDPDNTSAFVYDLSLKDSKFSEYESCPDGTHNCWYVEEFDKDGTLIGVKNRNGDNFLDVLVDDIWDDLWVEKIVWGEKVDAVGITERQYKGKCPEGSRRFPGTKDCRKVLDSTAPFIIAVSYLVELRDGKLYAKKDFPERNLKTGDLLDFSNMEPVQYYLALFLLMKLAGLPKPKKVKLNVRNAKLNNQKFMRMRIMSGEHGSSFMGAEAGESVMYPDRGKK